jgi:aminotransferase MxcL
VLLSLPYNRVVSGVFLHTLQATCKQHGVLFVLDEVVTGFRLALGGAQEFYQLEADYVCLSKGIAAGMPLSAVAGKRAYLERMDELQVSTTFGGEMLSLAVCQAVLRVYRDSDYIEHQAAIGRRLARGINEASEQGGFPLRVVGYDAIPLLRLSPDMAEQARLAEPFVAALARRGVLFRRDVNFLSSAHTEGQVDLTIDAVADALRELGQRGTFARG